ncbi:hypothetical protein GPALN_014375 [Globodera pallida]|nr:hypothetical protein GPALN_014375 [Globodera pallida]
MKFNLRTLGGLAKLLGISMEKQSMIIEALWQYIKTLTQRLNSNHLRSLRMNVMLFIDPKLCIFELSDTTICYLLLIFFSFSSWANCMVLLHPALSASNRLAAMNSFGTLLNRWHGTSLFRVDGTVLTQFRMIRRGGGDRHHSADDDEDRAYRKAKEEATRRAKEESIRRAKEESIRRAKEESIRSVKEEAQHQLGERRCLSDDEQLRREIHAELRSFSRQTVLPDNMKEVDAKVDAAANLDELLKTANLGVLLRAFTLDFNKHLYLNKRLSAYELEPVLENLHYALRVFFAGIVLAIFFILDYLLLPRDDGIMPDHRAIIAQQSAIDFDQFVQDYLRAGEVQIVYFYPGKSIAIAVLQPGALIKGRPFNDSGVLIRLDPSTNFLQVFEDVQNQIGTDLCNHVPATIPKPSQKTNLFFLLFYGILLALHFKYWRAARRRPIFRIVRRDGTAAKAQKK